jgi:hypothetical protein
MQQWVVEMYLSACDGYHHQISKRAAKCALAKQMLKYKNIYDTLAINESSLENTSWHTERKTGEGTENNAR